MAKDLDEGYVLPEDEAVDELEEEVPEEEVPEEEVPEEEVSEDEGEEDSKPVEQPHMIPKHRYDSVRQRTAAMEEQNARLQAELDRLKANAPTGTPDVNFAELDRKYENALADGDTDQAAQIKAQIRAAESEQYEKRANDAAQRASEEALARVKFDQTVETLTAAYPIFDPESAEYDQDTVDDVLQLQRELQSAGSSPSDALNRAVSYIIPARGAAPSVPPAQKRPAPVKRNVSTANSQPPNIGGVGTDSPKLGTGGIEQDVASMTQEEFDALPEATLRRMRGDMH